MVGLRSNRRLERAGVNALRTLLEDAGHIVQEIDGGNDHGEDLYVRLVSNGRLTSSIAAIQVKSGTRYRRAIGYAIPVGTHSELWRTSNIPVLGVVYDPEMQMLYWRNVTEYLQINEHAKSVPIGESDVLTAHTVPIVCKQIAQFIHSNKLELKPRTGESLRDAVKARLQSARQVQQDRQPPGGNPNLFFADMADWVERNEVRIQKFTRIALIACLVACGLMTVATLHQFSIKYAAQSINPWLWTAIISLFSFWTLYASYYEQRAGRQSILLKLIVAIPLITYCALSQVDLSPAAAGALTGIGVFVGGKGMFILGFVYVGREISRRRRIRAAYGEQQD